MIAVLGLFGFAPGRIYKTTPNALESFKENTMFTNVALTVDGYVCWD